MIEDEIEVPLTKPVRLMEMVLCGVLLGIVIHIGHAIALITYLSAMYVTFGGFLLVTVTDVISQLAADPISDTPMFLLSLAGCALFLATGGLSLDCLFDASSKITPDGAKIKSLDIELLVMAILSILNGAIFLLDAALIFRRKCSVKPSDQTAIKKLSKKPTSAEVEDRLMGTEKIRGGGVYIRARRGGAGGRQGILVPFNLTRGRLQERRRNVTISTMEMRINPENPPNGTSLTSELYERYTSEEDYIPPIPGTPQISVRYEENLKIRNETHSSQRTSTQGSTFRPSPRRQFHSVRSSPATSVMIDDIDQLSTPRSGGPSRKRRRRRKCCRILIWRRERIVSFYLKVIESALGIACLWIFVPEIWLEESTSPVSTAITFSALVTAVVLATALTINTLARNPPHRISFLLVAITGAASYFIVALIRLSSEDNLSLKMETPVLITGAVSLVDAALCLATFINNSTAAEQPQRPARRVDKARQKQPDPGPEELTVKKTKKTNIFVRCKKYFKKSEPQ